MANDDRRNLNVVRVGPADASKGPTRRERSLESLDRAVRNEGDGVVAQANLEEFLRLYCKPALRSVADPDTKPRLVSGWWFPIRYMPDPVSGEVINIGVGFINADGRGHLRLLEEFDRVSNLYRDRVTAHDVGLVLRAIRQAWREYKNPVDLDALPRPPVREVVYGRPFPASGESIATVLDERYHTLVTLARRSGLFAHIPAS